VGLSCGGKIKLLLQDCADPNSSQLLQSLAVPMESGDGRIFVTEFSGEKIIDSVAAGAKWSGAPLSEPVRLKAAELLGTRRSQVISEDGLNYFIQVFPRKSQLLIIGAAHITVDLVNFAAAFDFETTVIDPRTAFTGKTQFETKPDHVFASYPSEVLEDVILDENTYAVILSHDPKIDDNALQILLRAPVAYIGALGSRKTHERRKERLTQAGFSPEEIARIESPIGVDIHAVGAREIALSIMGSLIRVRNS
jgi:xanthine dehydrogenase accessory factor